MYNILVIDDHPFTLKILKQILERQKYAVNPFTNPLEALNFLNQPGTNIDLIISDVMMEQMSGLELLAKIKKKPKTVIHPIYSHFRFHGCRASSTGFSTWGR